MSGITVAGESFFETAFVPVAVIIVVAMIVLLLIAYICNKKKIIVKL